MIILIFSCDNKKSELEFEKNVMLEIYPSLIDSLWFYNNFPFSRNGKENKNEIRNNLQKELAGIKKNNSKIFATIYDTVYPIQKSEKNEFTKYFKDAIVSKNKENDTLKYALNRKKLSEINHTKIKFISKFRIKDKPWEINHKFLIYGVISFSRIQFDTQKKYGILTSDIICGGLCGHGYRVFIRKVKNKWVIDKVEEAWIS